MQAGSSGADVSSAGVAQPILVDVVSLTDEMTAVPAEATSVVV